MKELITDSECTCAKCGEVITYRSNEAGKTIRCKHCGEESQLPEPARLGLLQAQGPALPALKPCPICGTQFNFLESNCPACAKARRNKIVAVLMAVSVLILAVGGVEIWQFTRPKPVPPPPPPPPPGHMFIATPVAKPASNVDKDLRASNFNLERRHGETQGAAVGDIQNISDHVHHHLRAEVDLLDRTGVKIGSVSDYFIDLGAHATWHFVANVTNANVMSVRFVSCKDEQ